MLNVYENSKNWRDELPCHRGQLHSFLHFIENKYSMILSTQLHRPYFSNQIYGQGILLNSELDIQITRKHGILPPWTTIATKRFLL